MLRPLPIILITLTVCIGVMVTAHRLAGTQAGANLPVKGENSTAIFVEQESQSTLPNLNKTENPIQDSEKHSSEFLQNLAKLEGLLHQNRLQQAVQFIDSVYQQSSANELNKFKNAVFNYGLQLRSEEKYDSSIQLFHEYAKRFNDGDAWIHLGNIASATKRWDMAVQAYLESSAQEHDPVAYQDALQALLGVASHLRTDLQKQGDQLGVLDLYKRLHDYHPGFARFQLELAQAYILLKDYVSAKPLLEALRFDPEFGSIADQKYNFVLERENENFTAEADSNEPTSDIIVPMVRAGNSFLLDVQLNSQSERLLLDTGASITAVAPNLIRRHNLVPTGQSITLNTANGSRISALYKVSSIQIGPFRLRNLLVAEVDLGPNSIIQGLAGTDLLNQISVDYDYIIDNQRSALIFKEK